MLGLTLGQARCPGLGILKGMKQTCLVPWNSDSFGEGNNQKSHGTIAPGRSAVKERWAGRRFDQEEEPRWGIEGFLEEVKLVGEEGASFRQLGQTVTPQWLWGTCEFLLWHHGYLCLGIVPPPLCQAPSRVLREGEDHRDPPTLAHSPKCCKRAVAGPSWGCQGACSLSTSSPPDPGGHCGQCSLGAAGRQCPPGSR